MAISLCGNPNPIKGVSIEHFVFWKLFIADMKDNPLGIHWLNPRHFNKMLTQHGIDVVPTVPHGNVLILPKPHHKRYVVMFRPSVGALIKNPCTEDAFVQ
jgi:hypothetical protein